VLAGPAKTTARGLPVKEGLAPASADSISVDEVGVCLDAVCMDAATTATLRATRAGGASGCRIRVGACTVTSRLLSCWSSADRWAVVLNAGPSRLSRRAAALASLDRSAAELSNMTVGVFIPPVKPLRGTTAGGRSLKDARTPRKSGFDSTVTTTAPAGG